MKNLPSRRIVLLLLLAVMLITVGAHDASPAACCAPVQEARSGPACGCSRAQSQPERQASPHPCLVCLMQVGIYAPHCPQASLAQSAGVTALPQLAGPALDRLDRPFRPPILAG